MLPTVPNQTNIFVIAKYNGKRRSYIYVSQGGNATTCKFVSGATAWDTKELADLFVTTLPAGTYQVQRFPYFYGSVLA